MSVVFAFFVEHLIVFCFPGWQSSPEVTGWIKGIQWIWWTAKVQLKAEAATASRMYGNGLVFMARFGGCFCPPPSLEILFRNKHGKKYGPCLLGLKRHPNNETNKWGSKTVMSEWYYVLFFAGFWKSHCHGGRLEPKQIPWASRSPSTERGGTWKLDRPIPAKGSLRTKWWNQNMRGKGYLLSSQGVQYLNLDRSIRRCWSLIPLYLGKQMVEVDTQKYRWEWLP